MRDLFLRNTFRVAVVLFALAMAGVWFIAPKIVDAYGLTGTLVTLGGLYLFAHYLEARR